MYSVGTHFILPNGVKIPSIGFGTFRIPPGKEAQQAVHTAIEAGYRSIDTAAAYGNETDVGKAVQQSGVPRDQLFLTSKLWNSERGYDKTLAALDNSLEKMGCDYLDLYLVHWPAPKTKFANWCEINNETWNAMEHVYESGKVKAIGVSNYTAFYLEALLKSARIKPMVNQLEFHPGYQQPDTWRICQNHDIFVEAWSPLGNGELLQNELLTQIAQKYRRSAAQICLRWVLQHGIRPLAKSTSRARIAENLAIFDFAISQEDMAEIDRLPFSGGLAFDPDTFPHQ